MAGLLDEKTRETSTNDSVMRNYRVMKTRVLQTSAESDTTSLHMDLNNVNEEKCPDMYKISTPDGKVPLSPERPQPTLQKAEAAVDA